MKPIFTIVVFVLILTGCSQIDYRIDKTASPVYNSADFHVDEDTYEFRSRIFAKVNDEELYVAELAHLSFYENSRDEMFDDTWKTSRLRFGNLSRETGFTLIPDSVNIQHLISDRQIIKPLKIESRLVDCPDSINCWTYTLRYGRVNSNP